ncbi:MAG: UDP-3-O-(3-hydroxymyristoyl)glucosamine N-acyltransferase [Gemmatimonadota bacterium]|nr:MAG: UDP-3-O-(3-hydroxymyristoyl)glucosamine N-acyltransferase [Gemmatimonadota bacterium]
MQPDSSLTAGAIAELVGGKLVGSETTLIRGAASLDRAGPLDLSFVASRKYLPHVERTEAGAVLVTSGLGDVKAGPATRILVDDVHRALGQVLAKLYAEPQPTWGVHHTAIVGRGSRWSGRIGLGPYACLGGDVRLGSDCRIGHHATIESGAVLGDRCVIGVNALVCSAARLGNDVVLQAGARVGTPGYAFTSDGSGHARLQHVGGCFIEDAVEVGANTTIDRGSLGDTVVGQGTKIDNLVQIAHNVRIGERCLVMAQVGLAGTTVVEDDVVLAGQAGLAGHLTVGRGAKVAAQAGVIGDVAEGETVSGYPARPHREVLRQAASLRKLAKLTPFLERIAEKGQLPA